MRRVGFEPNNQMLQPSVVVWAVDRVTTVFRDMYECFGWKTHGEETVWASNMVVK
jgi:hypothetical protein